MFFSKVLSRVSGSIFRTSLLSASQRPQHFSNFSNHLHSLLPQSSNKLIPVQVNLLCPSINSPSPRFGFSSSASTETNERKNNGDSPNDDPAKTSEDAKEIDQNGEAKLVDQTEESDEPFDPHRHNAVFQIPDDSKPPGTVAAVLKALPKEKLLKADLNEVITLLKKIDHDHKWLMGNFVQQNKLLKNVESSMRHTLSKSIQIFGLPVIGSVVSLILNTFIQDPNTFLLHELLSTVRKEFEELNSTNRKLGVKIENLEEAVTKRNCFWQWLFGTKN